VLTDVLLEVGWVGGDNESFKADTLDRATLDAYAAELVPRQATFALSYNGTSGARGSV
jgi:hypothetical protein